MVADLTAALERGQLCIFDLASVASSGGRRVPPSPYILATPGPRPGAADSALSVFRFLSEPLQLEQELEALNACCLMGETGAGDLAEVNAHYRNRYFYSDYERKLFESTTFWAVWQAVVEEVRGRSAETISAQGTLSWSTWRRLKAELRPKKLFTHAFVQQTIAQKLRASDTINILLHSQAVSFYEECGHIHAARIDSIDQSNLLLTMTDRATGARTHAKFWNTRALPAAPIESEAARAVRPLDRDALAAFIIVLEQKHLVYRMLEEIFQRATESEAQRDAVYLAQRAAILERHLGSIVLRLRLSYTAVFAPAEAWRHYQIIACKVRAMLLRQKRTNASEGVRAELDLLAASVGRRIERKLEGEVAAELAEALGAAVGRCAPAALRAAADCLLLVKVLQTEGDFDTAKNGVYSRIMERFQRYVSRESAFAFADILLSLVSAMKSKIE